jgi:hypothetical protein
VSVVLDHLIVPSVEKDTSAAFLGWLLGLGVVEHQGPFAVVRIDDTLTFDFDDRHGNRPSHYAFSVDVATFEAVCARLADAAVPFGSGLAGGWDRRVDTTPSRRTVYVRGPEGHAYEVFTDDRSGS